MIEIHDKKEAFSFDWISFVYLKVIYESCRGYWDRDLNWIEGRFTPQEWMVDLVLKQIQINKKHADLL